LFFFKGKRKKLSPNDFQKLASKKSNPIFLAGGAWQFLRQTERKMVAFPGGCYLADGLGLLIWMSSTGGAAPFIYTLF